MSGLEIQIWESLAFMWLEITQVDELSQGGTSRVHTLVWGYPHGRGRCRPEKKRRADIQGFSKREAGSTGAAAEVGGGGEQGKEKHGAAQDLEKVGRWGGGAPDKHREIRKGSSLGQGGR